jgi:molybdopterin synthase sulfur carrier subunit
MAVLCLRGALKRRAGERSEHELGGGTVIEVLRELERLYPAVDGWIVDERGRIRRHINVFVNGERGDEETAVGESDRLEVIPAISGGACESC